MNLEQLRQLAHTKATEATAILEGDEPDVEKANALLDESQQYKDRADQMEKALTLADATKAKEKADEPEKAAVVVVEDEADKSLKVRPYTGLGEFLMDIKKAALGSVDPRLLPLHSSDAMDMGGYNLGKALGDEFVGGFTKSAFTKQTGLNEGVGSQGGFLVDTDRNGAIMQRVYNVGALLQRVDMVGISANSNGMTFNAVNETSRADGSRRGGIQAYWTAEAGSKTASKPDFRQLELKLKKVVGLVYATDELLQDANALESWIMQNLPEELRFVVEDAVIAGTGVGMPLGIIPSGATVSVAKETAQAATTIVSQNIVKMYSRMWAPSRSNAVWLINQDCEPQLFQMSLGVGTGGVALYFPPGGLSAAPYATLMGRPVIAHESCPTLGTVGDIIFADLSEYQMIEKGGIQSASSIHVNFTYDETVFRFVYRCDGSPKLAAPLTPKSGSGNTLSPFVTLATRS
jgi:HK97 family phage major capsid protein